MATLTQSATNKCVLKHRYGKDTEITIAATMITHHIKLPNNELLLHTASGRIRLKFTDEADRAAAIAILDSLIGLTITEAEAVVTA